MEEVQSLITTEEGSMVLDRLEAEQWERKHLAREAEHYILCFDAELSTYLDKKKEYLRKTADTNSGIRSGDPGRPTESMAIQSIKFDERYPALRWLKTIEILRRTLGERKNIFLRVRVEAARPKKVTPLKGRPGWVGYVQRRYAEELEKRFLVGETYSDKFIRACWQGILEKAVDIYKKIS